MHNRLFRILRVVREIRTEHIDDMATTHPDDSVPLLNEGRASSETHSPMLHAERAQAAEIHWSNCHLPAGLNLLLSVVLLADPYTIPDGLTQFQVIHFSDA